MGRMRNTYIQKSAFEVTEAFKFYGTLTFFENQEIKFKKFVRPE